MWFGFFSLANLHSPQECETNHTYHSPSQISTFRVQLWKYISNSISTTRWRIQQKTSSFERSNLNTIKSATFPLNQITAEENLPSSLCRREETTAKCLKIGFSICIEAVDWPIKWKKNNNREKKTFMKFSLNHVRTLLPQIKFKHAAFSASIAYSWKANCSHNRCMKPDHSDEIEMKLERREKYRHSRQCCLQAKIATEHELRRLEWACQLNNKTLFN